LLRDVRRPDAVSRAPLEILEHPPELPRCLSKKLIRLLIEAPEGYGSRFS
jgi:hypothetical protein